MAEGFLIETPRKNYTKSMEKIGNEYFDSLLSSFFFQDVKKDEDGHIETCRMHDLVYDLARSVVGKNECLIVENAHDIDYISEETRRLNLSVDLDDGEVLAKFIEALKRAKHLRTVFVCQQRIPFDIGNAFKENKRLRVLDLSESESESTYFSSSIGELKHLRYLDLPEESIIPKEIGRLRFLQTFGLFNVGDKKKNKNACGIEELKSLNLLRGYLRIGNLENVTSGTDACRANLKKKKNLRSLHLSWSKRSDYAKNVAEAVLEGLRPHPNLRYLWINGFQGSKLPKWIQDSSNCLPNLVELTLDGGIYIEQVAGFGALPSLESLTLRSMYNYKLECLGNEFYYSNNIAAATTTIAFPSLKELTLLGMQSLKEWVVPPLSTSWATYCFPLLEEITIDDCPLLSTITPTTTIFPSLKVLYLHNIDGSAVATLVTNNIKTLTTLRLRDIRKLNSLPRQGLMENNSTLLSLHIEDCYEFEGFFPPNKDDDDEDHEGGGQQQQLQQISQVVSSSSCSSSSSLQSLKVHCCPALRFYP